jgi:apolipoprotein N-acyltransferase
VRGLSTLAAATALLPLANGRWSVAAVAWIAPALLVRFMRTHSAGRAFAGGLLAMSVAEFVWWKGIVPLNGAAYLVASLLFGFVNLGPYLVDRWLTRRAGGFAGTLVLPSAMVLLETIAERFSPIGSWGSFAYTQSGDLALLQALSLTGVEGITFVVIWFASTVNWVMDEHVPSSRRLLRAAPFLAVVAGLHAFGLVRLERTEFERDVRVAAITPSVPTYAIRGDRSNGAIHAALSAVRKGKGLPPDAREAFRQRASAINRDLLERSGTEAQHGARVVLWSEGAGIVEVRDEPALIAEAAHLARSRGVFLAVSYLAIASDGTGGFLNRNVLITPAGETAWTWDKARPVPGMEDNLRPGDGRLRFAGTPFGRLSGVICFDLDFPALVRQAGLGNADLLLVAADDWPAVARTHEEMAKFRAIEQGLTVVRSTSSGTSVFYDPLGRTIARADYSEGARSLAATVPAERIATPYTSAPHVVRLFAGLVLLASVARRLVRRRRPSD